MLMAGSVLATVRVVLRIERKVRFPSWKVQIKNNMDEEAAIYHLHFIASHEWVLLIHFTIWAKWLGTLLNGSTPCLKCGPVLLMMPVPLSVCVHANSVFYPNEWNEKCKWYIGCTHCTTHHATTFVQFKSHGIELNTPKDAKWIRKKEHVALKRAKRKTRTS